MRRLVSCAKGQPAQACRRLPARALPAASPLGRTLLFVVNAVLDALAAPGNWEGRIHSNSALCVCVWLEGGRGWGGTRAEGALWGGKARPGLQAGCRPAGGAAPPWGAAARGGSHLVIFMRRMASTASMPLPMGMRSLDSSS